MYYFKVRRGTAPTRTLYLLRYPSARLDSESVMIRYVPANEGVGRGEVTSNSRMVFKKICHYRDISSLMSRSIYEHSPFRASIRDVQGSGIIARADVPTAPPPYWKWPHRKTNQSIRRRHPYARKSTSQSVLSRMQLALHAPRRTLHGSSCLVL